MLLLIPPGAGKPTPGPRDWSMSKEDWETSDIDFHEDFIVQFLRRNKYDVRRSCKNIQNFVVLRKEQSEMFRNIEDEYFSSKSSTKFIRLLPKRCPEGCAITLFPIRQMGSQRIRLHGCQASDGHVLRAAPARSDDPNQRRQGHLRLPGNLFPASQIRHA
ncbi:alpha-tocopherol transfer protein-like [Caerostris extrusa]|uniref:Alpha-tocopherol transfer protein-like n=1 Tax=Caerostris extrusa TaxID=172846 RepID=A0AAV4M3Y9_CAEEX|nr:alpha-tocopherol transfer protein-like [Caerostris extrusa]